MHGRPLLGLTLGAALLSAGCTSAVKVTPFEGADTGVCREVAAAWPATVAGEQSREVAVESETVAAWGDPAIIARCGAPLLGPTTDQCLDIDGVDWVAEPLDDGVRFTTYGRHPAIQVLVPDAYAPEPLLMPAFAPTAQVVDQTGGRCS
ncbi:MAG: DUF3515 family protein [Ornithinimicrobium sp.]|jgi:hypothetical protein|uniref:DUF3515 family protein n=1 Tax=Ornithinimicrobium sp. TaxID=1977084 RepID=UPI0017BDD1C9|nr:DUF3515 family protein [Actinomycetota bacterium]